MPYHDNTPDDWKGWAPFLDMMKDAKRRDHEQIIREALLPNAASLLRDSAQLRHRILRRLLHLPSSRKEP